MMRIYALLILVLLILPGGCREYNTSIHIEDGKKYDCIQVNPDKKSIGCGVLAVVVAKKFCFVSEKKTFLVMVPCPEMHGDDFFEQGQRYTIQLTTDKTLFADYTVINTYQRSSLPVYYAQDIIKSGK